MRFGAESDRLGLGLHVGFWRRHAWPYREARRLLAEGVIGEPRLLRLAQWDAEPPPAGYDPAVSGGIEVDCGVHECDLAAWLCGSPVVEAFARGAPTRARSRRSGRRIPGGSARTRRRPARIVGPGAYGRVRRGRTQRDRVRAWRARLRGARRGRCSCATRTGLREVLRRPTTCCSTRWRARSTRSPQPWQEARCPTRRGRPTPQPRCRGLALRESRRTGAVVRVR